MKLSPFSRTGFTLLELLVVVTIIVILTGVALPYVQQYVEDARYARAKADLDEVKSALALYETRRGEPYSVVVAATSTAKLVDRGFITKNPVDPWGTPYKVYGARGEISTWGPDGSENTLDDLSVPYQPPLACIAAYWQDGNKDAAVDSAITSGIGPDGDTIILTFSRSIRSPFPDGTLGGDPTAWAPDSTALENRTSAADCEIGIRSGTTDQNPPTHFAWFDVTGKLGKIWWDGITAPVPLPNFTPGQSVVVIRSSTQAEVAGTEVTLVDYNGTKCKNDEVKITSR